jgi:hypothetical protein
LNYHEFYLKKEEEKSMLYTGCSGCGAVVPLFCAGQFLPHMPMYVQSTPLGIVCNICGILPPVFTCTLCGTVQRLYVQGMNFNPQQVVAGGVSRIAPVVQSNANTKESAVKSLLSNAAKSFAGEFGKGVAKQLLGVFFGGGGF